MGLLKMNDYLNKEYSDIMSETREKRAFDLGMAYGYFQLYNYIKMENDKETADNCFKSMLSDESNERKHFKKMVELSEQENTKAEKFNKYKGE